MQYSGSTDKAKLPETNWKLEELFNQPKNKDGFIVSGEDKVYWLLPYLAYFGGGILDKNFDLIIESNESKTAISFYKDLKNKYKIAPKKSDVGSFTEAQMFLDGKILFYLSGRWMYPIISEKAGFNWAVINFPYGLNPIPCDTSGWAISKNSKHKAAAKKFVDYISGEDSSKHFANTGLIVPARIKSANLLNNFSHNEKIFIDVIQNSEKNYINKDYIKLTDKLNKKLDL